MGVGATLGQFAIFSEIRFPLAGFYVAVVGLVLSAGASLASLALRDHEQGLATAHAPENPNTVPALAEREGA